MSVFSALKLPSETPAKMEIRHPTTDQVLLDAKTGEPAYLLLLSQDSAVAKKVDTENLNRRLLSRAKYGAEQMEEESLAKMVKLTKGWHLVDLEGNALMAAEDKMIECNAANALMAYRELPWLLEQAAEFIRSRSNFVKA
jgi:hypothetical protein